VYVSGAPNDDATSGNTPVGRPHSEQNLAVARIGWLQCKQVNANGAAHFAQNFAATSLKC
jgi:hypothetical protein